MRDISTITVEEGAGLWNAVMPKWAVKPFRGNSYHYKKTKDLPERICFWSGVDRLGVYFTGRVWADCDLDAIELDQNKVREYLKSINILLS